MPRLPIFVPRDQEGAAPAPATRGTARAARAGILVRAGVQAPVLVGAAALAGALVTSLGPWLGSEDGLAASILLMLVLASVSLGLAAWRLERLLLRPLRVLEESVGELCQGGTGERLSAADTGVLGELADDIQSLSEELLDLYEDMDNRVARQTRRLAQKTASLKILYEVAASINHAQDLTELLTRYLRILKEMVNGRTATVRLAAPDGRSRIVGSVGPDNTLMLEHEMLPLALCRCGRVLVPGEVLCDQNPRECSRRNGRRMYGPSELEVVEVPLQYHDERLGTYRIYVDRPGIGGREDVLDLLTTIGSHLGMAIAQQRSDAEARRLSIVEERNHLAHELHDSLAQTLAGLRFQVRMLQETLSQQGTGGAAVTEAQRIRNALDEAHTELRELLNRFRAPLDQRGLIPALEELVARFRRETGLSIFFQGDCQQPHLSAHEEMQMLRVVQESLTNVRKHAQAHTVRVLLRCRAPGTYLLLVEDDGVGFERPPSGGRPGEHIGLSIMEERARRIGAELRIESEPGDGTRVEMLFKPGRRLSTGSARGGN
jgi:two-component system, NarL family, nitrate/nitrite sensor histidine kinase NarX